MLQVLYIQVQFLPLISHSVSIKKPKCTKLCPNIIPVNYVNHTHGTGGCAAESLVLELVVHIATNRFKKLNPEQEEYNDMAPPELASILSITKCRRNT
jgi:hypothetical protein